MLPQIADRYRSCICFEAHDEQDNPKPDQGKDCNHLDQCEPELQLAEAFDGQQIKSQQNN
ncbi:hypothetical protein D3C80_1924670 [compost metagenome]